HGRRRGAVLISYLKRVGRADPYTVIVGGGNTAVAGIHNADESDLTRIRDERRQEVGVECRAGDARRRRGFSRGDQHIAGRAHPDPVIGRGRDATASGEEESGEGNLPGRIETDVGGTAKDRHGRSPRSLAALAGRQLKSSRRAG